MRTLVLSVARAGGEGLARAGRNGRVTVDDFRDHAAVDFDAERERRDVEEQLVFDCARKDAGLYGRAEGDHFIGIQFSMGPRAEEHFDRAPHHRYSRGAADHDDFVDLFWRDTGVLHAVAAGAERAIDDVFDEAFEQFAGDFAVVMFALPFELDVRDGQERQRLLRADDIATQGLDRFADVGEVFTPFRLQIFERDAQQAVVDVVAAQMRIAIGGEHFEDAFLQLEDRDVEGATAQIVDGDDAFLALVEPVGERGGGGFVDETKHFETGDSSGVAGGLPLRVIEVGGDCDDGLRNSLA